MTLVARSLICLAPLVPGLMAQGTLEDYERANGIRDKLQNLALNVTGAVTWIETSHRFYYRRSVPGGNEFVIFDAGTLEKKPAFEHEKLAAALSMAAGEKYTAVTLPFATFSYLDNTGAIRFVAGDATWECDISGYTCRKTGPAPQGLRGGRRGRPPDGPFEDPPAEYPNDVHDGMADLSPQENQRGRNAFAPFASPEVPQARASPDGKWEALIENYNVFLRRKGEANAAPLSYDGSEGNYYTLSSLNWSPDSNHLVAYRVRPGFRRQVHFVESSPADQLQPKHWSRDYAKPGDALDVAQPVLFNVAAGKQIHIDNSLFPNAYSLSNPVWRGDSRAFTFEYNQRGHQVYRVIEISVEGNAHALVSEESTTFVSYRSLSGNQRDTGKKYRHDIDDGKEFLWMSERDGWAHLYLYDGVTGKVKNQVTRGNWVVRAVDRVDEKARQIWFQASGMYPGKDPYFVHYFRINFDGSGLTALTEADASHAVEFSPDGDYYVDTWSRVDQPPVVELRRTEDRKLVAEVERGDARPLLDAGWRPPEVFTAKGRDRKTDIWGVIYRPLHFDPAKKYPVIESVYAGPQGSFVPKTFSGAVQPLAELGFIVVQVDGMGTNNRSKAFHDVAWRNLGDAGFEDRILWHKAVAEKYPYYDITRVGIYGNSAGGQNAMGALLFHPDFYKVAVANSGCHDNRMDKIWWNEQWMGWPVGPQYAASSNVENAYRLKGKLLLIVGELDTNVDPASTLQVVNALIKAGKRHDLLFVPGGGHGAGGAFGQRMLQDFFVHHLLGVEPPDWNQQSAPDASPSGRTGAGA